MNGCFITLSPTPTHVSVGVPKLTRFDVLTATMVSSATEAEPQSSVLLSRQMTPLLLCLLQGHVFPIHALFTQLRIACGISIAAQLTFRHEED